jgi:PKD repeat protein
MFRFRFLSIAATIFILITTGCFGTRMVFNGITGPDTVAENSSATFSIDVEGETPDLYQWAVEPSDAGTIENETTSSCIFHADDVDSDTLVDIRVTIRSPHDGPYVVGKTVVILNTGQSPVAMASADKTSVQVGEIIQFTDESTDPDGISDIISREWDFSYEEADGFQTDSTDQDPVHSYSEEGTYYVQLRVTDRSGLTDMLDEPIVITVGGTQVVEIAFISRSRTTSEAGNHDESVMLSVIFEPPAPSPETLTYSWTCPYGSFSDPAALDPIWTPPDQPIKCEITIEVSDTTGSSDTASVNQWVTSYPVIENASSPTNLIPSETLNTAPSGTLDPSDLVYPTAGPDGNVVYINYWATWCGYCIAELPDLQEMYDGYNNEELQWLLVNLAESLPTVNNFRNANPYEPTYWVLDEDSSYFAIIKGWNNGSSGLPQHVLFDRDGRCRWSKLGGLLQGTSELEAAIDELL